jgi:hypothetical protein
MGYKLLLDAYQTIETKTVIKVIILVVMMNTMKMEKMVTQRMRATED